MEMPHSVSEEVLTRQVVAAGVVAVGLFLSVVVIATVGWRPLAVIGSGLMPWALSPTPTLSPDEARFCLQAPLSGTIAFSNLHYVQSAPGLLPHGDLPTVQVRAVGLPVGRTVVVDWWDRDGGGSYPTSAGGPSYPVSVFTTNAQGTPTGIFALRRARMPASHITLEFWDGRQRTGAGSGVAC